MCNSCAVKGKGVTIIIKGVKCHFKKLKGPSLSMELNGGQCDFS